MKKMFKRALMVITLMLVMSAMSNIDVKADTTWGSYFGANEGWYEGAEGNLVVRSASEWSANMDMIGWGGIWGAQVYQDVARGVGNVNVVRGGKYYLSFDMTSSGCNKWVYIKVTTGENVVHNDWIYLEKGKTYHYSEFFVANRNADSIYFGMGGDFGDRAGVSTDGDTDVRYALHQELFGTYVTWDEDPTYSTTITCSNFSLVRGKGTESGIWDDNSTFKYNGYELTISGSGNTGTNKPAEATSSTKNMLKKVTSLKVKNLKKKKVKITWKKIKGAKGYEIVYAKNKKFTKDVNTKKVKKASKTSLTIKGLQKKKTYYFKVRAYNTVNGKTVYGEWSKVKKIKIKK